MEHLGRHVIIELWGCGEIINDAARVERSMRDAVQAANATLLNIFVHEFSPQGVTGVAVLAESHLSIHTWPEYGYVAADVFTCGSTTKPEAAAEVLRKAFKASTAEVRELERGVMPPSIKQNRSRQLANA
ncbi:MULTISPECIES: adenosylmethionine decarboxylase [unclassified Schlesneria]|uniref:adenosylmethionine decarboxylase n=1 Tax=Schlesneria TaxID=656899 RepID=UPI002EE136C8